VKRTTEPEVFDERPLLLQWLAFHRDALAAKIDCLTPEQLVIQSTPPSALTLLGLVRHLTEMERAYLVWALGGGGLEWVYCSDRHPDADLVGLSPDMAEESIRTWDSERARADELISGHQLDDVGQGNGYTLRWNLIKLIQEYARHNGHADLIRQAIDGAVGE
jgi:hypothetical protein